MQDIEELEIRLLSESDIPAAMKLKEAAGWNQTENDWRCLLRLEPHGCFAATLRARANPLYSSCLTSEEIKPPAVDSATRRGRERRRAQ